MRVGTRRHTCNSVVEGDLTESCKGLLCSLVLHPRVARNYHSCHLSPISLTAGWPFPTPWGHFRNLQYPISDTVSDSRYYSAYSAYAIACYPTIFSIPGVSIRRHRQGGAPHGCGTAALVGVMLTGTRCNSCTRYVVTADTMQRGHAAHQRLHPPLPPPSANNV